MPDSDTNAVRALTLALVNEQAQKSHEELCAERYGTINAKIDKLETIIKWVGGLIATSLIGVLTWSVNQQIDSAKAQQVAAAAKIELLQKQVSDSNAGRRYNRELLERMQPHNEDAAPPTNAAP